MDTSEETRKNSQKAIGRGGVKTPEGKAVSRYNAQKHAILRETVSEYEKADAEEIFNELVGDLKPQGRMQELLIEVIASNVVRMHRIAKAEGEAIKEALSPKSLGASIPNHEYVPQMSASTLGSLSLYSRYQTSTENRIFRLLSVLQQLKG